MSDVKQFQGVAKGFHGEVKATLTLEDGTIKSASSEHSPTAYVGDLGIQRMIRKIESAQSLEVDAVAGATFSSNAFLEASKKALAVSTGDLTAEEALKVNVGLGVPAGARLDAVSSASINPNKTQENTSVARPTIAHSKTLNYDLTYDVVIAGAGGAGLSAAVEAARAGLKVLICEKSGIPGGTTNYSGGVIQAAGTSYQKQFTAYQEDSTDKHAELWLKAGEALVDEALVRDLAKGSPDNLEWLTDMGLKWTDVYGHSHIPYVPDELYAERIHVYENGGGSGTGTILTQVLLKSALSAGAEIYYDTPVTTLIQDTKTRTVTGAVIEHQGQTLNVRATKGVVLATASIDHNPALAKELSPQQFNDLNYNTVLSAKTDTGDGIMMGMSSGAAINGIGGCIDFCGKTGNATNNRIPTIPMIYVNGIGNRFVCEDATYAYSYHAIFQQEKQLNKQTYMIFGADSIKEPGSAWNEASLAADVANGTVKRAESLKDLAHLIQVPVQNLTQTVTTWNEQAAKGQDLQFGRKQGIKPIAAPFYAYQNKATNLGSLGGLKINTDCQVLDHFDEVIDGLYAAGLNAGGWMGGYYPGSGTAIAGIVHQGRKAGQALGRKK